MTPDLAELQQRARAEWGRTTPYRCGIIVGREGIAIANPYSTPQAARNFEQGVRCGAILGGGGGA